MSDFVEIRKRISNSTNEINVNFRKDPDEAKSLLWDFEKMKYFCFCPRSYMLLIRHNAGFFNQKKQGSSKIIFDSENAIAITTESVIKTILRDKAEKKDFHMKKYMELWKNNWDSFEYKVIFDEVLNQYTLEKYVLTIFQKVDTATNFEVKKCNKETVIMKEPINHDRKYKNKYSLLLEYPTVFYNYTTNWKSYEVVIPYVEHSIKGISPNPFIRNLPFHIHVYSLYSKIAKSYKTDFAYSALYIDSFTGNSKYIPNFTKMLSNSMAEKYRKLYISNLFNYLKDGMYYADGGEYCTKCPVNLLC